MPDRSAVTGRYVSPAFAAHHPDTTVEEHAAGPYADFGPISVGEAVHYVSYGTPGGEFPSVCRAAVVTEADPDYADVVSLAVLNPSGLFFDQGLHHVPVSLMRGGTWHTAGEHSDA